MIEAPPFLVGVGAGFARLRQSSIELYHNQKESIALRKQRKESPESITFDLHHKLTQAGVDFGKILSLTWLTIYARWYTPVTVYFFPDMLPSTFESDAMRSKKRNERAMKQRNAVLETVAADDVLSLAASTALRASTKSKALESIMEATGDQEFKQLPNPVFYAASRVFDGPYRIFPKPLHVRAIRQGLKRLAEGDDALRRTELATLPADLLEAACDERGVSASTPDDMVTGLKEWLTMTKAADSQLNLQGDRVPAENTRLALIALNTASTIRKTDSAYAALYVRKGF